MKKTRKKNQNLMDVFWNNPLRYISLFGAMSIIIIFIISWIYYKNLPAETFYLPQKLMNQTDSSLSVFNWKIYISICFYIFSVFSLLVLSLIIMAALDFFVKNIASREKAKVFARSGIEKAVFLIYALFVTSMIFLMPLKIHNDKKEHLRILKEGKSTMAYISAKKNLRYGGHEIIIEYKNIIGETVKTDISVTFHQTLYLYPGNSVPIHYFENHVILDEFPPENTALSIGLSIFFLSFLYPFIPGLKVYRKST